MSPQTIGEITVRQVPLLRADQEVASAVKEIVDAGLPALPVIGEDGTLQGIFGEREFMGALFPGYLKELHYAGFVTRALDDMIDRRSECGLEAVSTHMNTEHVDVGEDYSDVQVAEIFLHHRVLIVPVTKDGRVRGVITRSDFFRALQERFTERSAARG